MASPARDGAEDTDPAITVTAIMVPEKDMDGEEVAPMAQASPARDLAASPGRDGAADMDPATTVPEKDTDGEEEAPMAPASPGRDGAASPGRPLADQASPARDRAVADGDMDPAMDMAMATQVRTANGETSRRTGHKYKAASADEGSSNKRSRSLCSHGDIVSSSHIHLDPREVKKFQSNEGMINCFLCTKSAVNMEPLSFLPLLFVFCFEKL